LAAPVEKNQVAVGSSADRGGEGKAGTGGRETPLFTRVQGPKVMGPRGSTRKKGSVREPRLEALLEQNVRSTEGKKEVRDPEGKQQNRKSMPSLPRKNQTAT